MAERVDLGDGAAALFTVVPALLGRVGARSMLAPTPALATSGGGGSGSQAQKQTSGLGSGDSLTFLVAYRSILVLHAHTRRDGMRLDAEQPASNTVRFTALSARLFAARR